MDLTHEGADHTLDRAAEPRPGHRAVKQLDAMGHAASAQRLAVEFAGIVGVQDSRFSAQRPFRVDTILDEKGPFGGGDIWAANILAVGGIDQDHIHQGMVHLDDMQREVGRHLFANDRLEGPGGIGAMPPLFKVPRAQILLALFHGIERRGLQPALPAGGPDMSIDGGHVGFLGLGIELRQSLSDDVLNLIGYPRKALVAAGGRRQEGKGVLSAVAEALDQQSDGSG
ncbi:Uncharacterized protein MLTONO_p0517 (plasmid) [Mesorhizobium loti]|nr:Uncharacterized protein MLTONO_p0517 [Mesorhizobium loti]